MSMGTRQSTEGADELDIEKHGDEIHVIRAKLFPDDHSDETWKRILRDLVSLTSVIYKTWPCVCMFMFARRSQ